LHSTGAEADQQFQDKRAAPISVGAGASTCCSTSIRDVSFVLSFDDSHGATAEARLVCDTTSDEDEEDSDGGSQEEGDELEVFDAAPSAEGSWFRTQSELEPSGQWRRKLEEELDLGPVVQAETNDTLDGEPFAAICGIILPNEPLWLGLNDTFAPRTPNSRPAPWTLSDVDVSRIRVDATADAEAASTSNALVPLRMSAWGLAALWGTTFRPATAQASSSASGSRPWLASEALGLRPVTAPAHAPGLPGSAALADAGRQAAVVAPSPEPLATVRRFEAEVERISRRMPSAPRGPTRTPPGVSASPPKGRASVPSSPAKGQRPYLAQPAPASPIKSPARGPAAVAGVRNQAFAARIGRRGGNEPSDGGRAASAPVAKGEASAVHDPHGRPGMPFNARTHSRAQTLAVARTYPHASRACRTRARAARAHASTCTV
jgi:hypothetical protein